MYDDAALRKVDADVANTLVAVLASSKAGAGAVYAIALDEKTRFDLRIDVEDDATAGYYGFTDVLYTGTSTSFLFGGKKFGVLAATSGLSLRIVLNVGHAKDSGQRLSTLVHEIGVHGTLLFGAIMVFRKNLDSVNDEKQLEGALLTQLENGAYSADYHHIEFGKGTADDYNELKKQVLATLDDWAGGLGWKIAALVGTNKWAALKEDFVKATKRGEELHEKVYWHPVVEYQDLLKRVDSVAKTAEEFNKSGKSGQSGLLPLLKSLFGGNT